MEHVYAIMEFAKKKKKNNQGSKLHIDYNYNYVKKKSK